MVRLTSAWVLACAIAIVCGLGCGGPARWSVGSDADASADQQSRRAATRAPDAAAAIVEDDAAQRDAAERDAAEPLSDAARSDSTDGSPSEPELAADAATSSDASAPDGDEQDAAADAAIDNPPEEPDPCLRQATEVTPPAELPEGAPALDDWPGYQRDRGHTGFVPVSLDEARFAMRFSIALPTATKGSVSSAGSRLFLTAGLDVLCIDAFSGRRLWTHDFGAGAWTTPPATAGDVVYVQVEAADIRRYLWGLDSASGAVRFQQLLSGSGSDAPAPVVDAVPAVPGVFLLDTSGLHSFDGATGTQRWVTTARDSFPHAPTVMDTSVLAYDSNTPAQLRIVDKDTGKLAGSIADPGPTSSTSLAGAVVAGSGDWSIANVGGRLLFFDHALESIRWELDASFSGQPLLAHGSIYVKNGAAIEARDELTGDLQWAYTPAQGATPVPKVVTNTHLFATMATGTVAISLATHEVVWSTAATGELALAQGALLISSGTTLTAIDLEGDTDEDGLPDAWEASHGGDFAASEDQDADGLSNADELAEKTDPLNADSDGDGLDDGAELDHATDPLDADTDLDLLSDCRELAVHTDPLELDSDGDGMDDGLELGAGLNPLLASDALEDRDGDGFSNIHEARAGTDPKDAADVPVIGDWGTVQGNARHDGYQPAFLDAAAFAVRWSRTLPAEMRGLSVGGGRVFVMENGDVLALDALTGTEQWLFELDSRWTAGLGFPDSSTPPAYADGRVYIRTTGSQGDSAVSALDATTGREAFRTELANDTAGAASPPTLFAGRMLVGSVDPRSLFAFDQHSGSLLWNTPWVPRDIRTDRWDPAADSEHVYATGPGGQLRVLAGSSGAVLSEMLAGLVQLPTPVIGRKGELLFDGSVLLAIDPAAQRVIWASDHPALSFGVPAVGNGQIYAIRDGTLEVYSEGSGRLLWSWRPARGSLTSNVVLTASQVFVASDTVTYAIDLVSHDFTFAHPFGGTLALGNEGALFVMKGTRIDAIEVEGDRDADGLPQSWERRYGGDLSPSADDDGDGLSARQELAAQSDPLVADSDGDGLDDGAEVAIGSDPTRTDSDEDGLSDAQEADVVHSDPVIEDSDGDRLQDGLEVQVGLDPLDEADGALDRDHDGHANAAEALAGSDLDDPSSVPALQPWAMYQGNARHDGYQPFLLDHADFAKRWSVTWGSDPAAAAVSDQKVYLANLANLYGYALASGQQSFATPLSSGMFMSPVLTSAPSYANGLLYLHVSNEGLRAYNAGTGVSAFNRTTSSDGSTHLAPTIVGSRIITTGYDQLAAFDALSGQPQWSAEAIDIDPIEPAVDGSLAYFIDHGSVRALNVTTGATAFEITASLALATPVLGSQDELLVARRTLTAIDLVGGREIWRSRWTATAAYGTPVVGNGRVVARRSGGGLDVFSERSGERLWTFTPMGDTLTSNLVLTATHVFAASSNRTYAVDLASGQSDWSYPLGGPLALGPDGTLVIVGRTTIDAISLLP